MAGGIIIGKAPIPFGDSRTQDYFNQQYRAKAVFGDLSDPDLASMQEALNRLQAAATQAVAAVAAGGDSFGTKLTVLLTGASSTVAAAASNAYATQNLADVMAAKLDRFKADPGSHSHADAVQFVADCGQYANVQDILATMAGLTATALVQAVDPTGLLGGPNGLLSPGGPNSLPWWAWVGGAAALAMLLGWRPLAPGRG